MSKITYTLLIFFSFMFFSTLTSCFVSLGEVGGHKHGWDKNTNNPHHPFSTNPGKGHKKHK